MTTKIPGKIVDSQYIGRSESVAPGGLAEAPTDRSDQVTQMHENVARPEVLFGATYKIKTPLSEHAMYVTINDIVLNPDTPHEIRRPFEIFINSKNMDHFQWIVALTRIMSAVFRKGGDVTFLVEEMRSVFDPQGGYFQPGGRYMPSVIAEIGDVIERHLRTIGLMPASDLDPERARFIREKQREYAKKEGRDADGEDQGFPETAEWCPKCHTKACVMMDNCLTCLNCGYSKCN